MKITLRDKGSSFLRSICNGCINLEHTGAGVCKLGRDVGAVALDPHSNYMYFHPDKCPAQLPNLTADGVTEIATFIYRFNSSMYLRSYAVDITKD